MRVFYSLTIFFYGIAIRVSSVFNVKARLWVRGRKNLFAELETKIKSSAQPVAWFHCASLGEFEQGRPLMEAFRKKNPSFRILLTFFSPSGYEVRKNYPGADIVCYLPLDTPGNAKRFVSIVKPSLVYFIKYEIWLNFLSEFRRKKIPHFLVSAIFRPDQVFFKWYGGAFRKALHGFDFIFTQEEKSVELLHSIDINSVIVAGDTRFDRVKEIADGAQDIELANIFSADSNVVIAGSTWPQDEEVLFPAIAGPLRHGWKLIIAPHELGEAHLRLIEEGLQQQGITKEKIARYSEGINAKLRSASVLIIDNIGMLSSLYRYGRVAYIGGGFGKSIHNTLEAAVYSIPVVFGPRFEKFNEAKGLIAKGGGFGVKSGEELKNVLLALMMGEKNHAMPGKAAGKFVSEHTGATKIVLEKSVKFFNR
ncbi:MAG: 3-deoxy-D-manno-octulosonic acid transferase [Bacteroidota bacterium]|nr:3-deoxy-D-manno-octulosonic acid transferase [Bacteroidota bacterium]